MTIEENAPTSVGQAQDGAIADLRIIRRPENVTEANLAEVFAAYLQGKALYCFDDKHWYLWNSQRWQKDKQNRIILKAEAFVRQTTKMAIDAGEPDIARRILGFLTAQKLDNLVKLAKPRLAVNLTDFDADPMQICVENGVIDLASGKLLDPNPALRHSKMAGVSYDAHASCPRFMQFLKDISPDDPELRGYVQKVVGYTLTGSTKEQCLFMFLGGGANGKSTLVNVLTKLMGDYAANTAASTLMASNKNQVGDDGGVDSGVERRLSVIPFDTTITKSERVVSIGKIVAVEQTNQVIALAITQLCEVIKRGYFEIPETVEETTTQWFHDADLVLGWLEDGRFIPGHRRFVETLRANLKNDPEFELVRLSDSNAVRRRSLV